MPEPSLRLKRVKTIHEFEVSGVPDTRAPYKGSITVRPETLQLAFHDGQLRWIGVRGRTVLRTGTIGRYREIGFGGFEPDADDLPDWLDSALTAWGLTWPGGTETRTDGDPPPMEWREDQLGGYQVPVGSADLDLVPLDAGEQP